MNKIKSHSSIEVSGTVDYVIIAIREDEFAATLHFFPPTGELKGEHRTYEISDFNTTDGSPCRVALLRSIEQGHSAAHSAASDAIFDLKPNILVLVGIAGAVPESEFSLGDVVVANRIVDFSVTASLANGETEYAAKSAPIHKSIQDMASRIPALKSKLGDWNTMERLNTNLPGVTIDDQHLPKKEGAWKEKIRTTLSSRFYPEDGSKPRLPLVTVAPIASGNTLMKDPELIQDWLKIARDLKAVEMELPGVYEAAHRLQGDIPVLAIRGISDIVGFKRNPAWTEFACRSAASFTKALLMANAINQGKSQQKISHVNSEISTIKLKKSPENKLSLFIKNLKESSAQKIISDILLGRLSADDVTALAQDPKLAKQALFNLVCPHEYNSDTWRYMLFADICAQMQDPTDAILNIAFDNTLTWGQRTNVLPSLRFLNKTSRTRAVQILNEYANNQDLDNIKLAIIGYGYLGAFSAIRWKFDDADMHSSTYAIQKLGFSVIYSFLNCFVHFYEESADFSPLNSMSNALDLAKKCDLPLHPMDFMRKTLPMRAGLAPELFRHAVKHKHEALLEGLLYVLNRRPTPHITNELFDVASNVNSSPAIKKIALNALANIQSPVAHKLSERATEENLPYSLSMLMLSIGVNKANKHADIVLKEIQAGIENQDSIHADKEHLSYALWAAGELGKDTETFRHPLIHATTLQNDPLSRAIAWLGLSKMGHPIALSELQVATELATSFYEKLIISIAGLHCGYPQFIESAIHDSQANGAPVWKLQGHLYRDFVKGVELQLALPGRYLLQLLQRGDPG